MTTFIYIQCNLIHRRDIGAVSQTHIVPIPGQMNVEHAFLVQKWTQESGKPDLLDDFAHWWTYKVKITWSSWGMKASIQFTSSKDILCENQFLLIAISQEVYEFDINPQTLLVSNRYLKWKTSVFTQWRQSLFHWSAQQETKLLSSVKHRSCLNTLKGPASFLPF